MSTLSFHGFSWRGDKKWANASKWTVYAPIVQCVNFAFAVVEVACGSVWIVQLGSHLTVYVISLSVNGAPASTNSSLCITDVCFEPSPMIIQTLLLPGCSLFNTIPSIHLHMLLRNNPPRLAMWFSFAFALLYLTSVLLSLAACKSSTSAVPAGLRRAECPQGTPGGPVQGVSKSVWDVMLAFQVSSIAGYTLHGAMAWKVHRVLKSRKERGEVEAVDPDEEAKRRQRARELWTKNYEMQGL